MDPTLPEEEDGGRQSLYSERGGGERRAVVSTEARGNTRSMPTVCVAWLVGVRFN